MARKTARTTATPPAPATALLAGLAGWLVPGAGHWMLGRRVRGVILFVVIHVLFWSGIVIGGVFTVDPREEPWWHKAQLCVGSSGLWSHYRQQATFNALADRAVRERRRGGPAKAVEQLKADKNLALVWPAAGPARIFTGVAGMLNLLCIIDAVLLALLGIRGETPVKTAVRSEEAQ